MVLIVPDLMQVAVVDAGLLGLGHRHCRPCADREMRGVCDYNEYIYLPLLKPIRSLVVLSDRPVVWFVVSRNLCVEKE